tara:strand:+ start:4677 stop:4967 length:291 start_codon:yes stop_codon:yes gene_type:complete
MISRTVTETGSVRRLPASTDIWREKRKRRQKRLREQEARRRRRGRTLGGRTYTRAEITEIHEERYVLNGLSPSASSFTRDIALAAREHFTVRWYGK